MQLRSTLSAKFMFGLGIILLCVITVFSFLTYDYLKKMFIREAYEKTDILMGYIDATMEYVRDELRPQIFHDLPGNVFINQVMSSSFINTGIMKRFKQRFPRYVYRRVAIDPMNPSNKADAFEEGYIRLFQNDRTSKKEWRGLITRNGEDYFIHLKAIVMEEQCLLCHGDPAVSPESLNRHYGKVHGRFRKVGEVVGLESIAAPVSATFRQLRQVAFFFFLLGIAGMAVLFAVLNYFHYRLAVVPLKRVSSFFKEVVNGHRGLDIHFDSRDYEEVYELAESFNRMMGYLKKSEEERKEMEERVRQADKLASIGQLAAGVAHEINNPLSLILGYTKLLRKECPAHGQTEEDLNIVYQNARICKMRAIDSNHRVSAGMRWWENVNDVVGFVDIAIFHSYWPNVTQEITDIRSYMGIEPEADPVRGVRLALESQPVQLLWPADNSLQRDRAAQCIYKPPDGIRGTEHRRRHSVDDFRRRKLRH